MAELVDALDLGSSVLVAWEFDSPRSHKKPANGVRERTKEMIKLLAIAALLLASCGHTTTQTSEAPSYTYYCFNWMHVNGSLRNTCRMHIQDCLDTREYLERLSMGHTPLSECSRRTGTEVEDMRRKLEFEKK